MIVCRALAVFVFIYFAISAISVGQKVLTILRQVYDIQPYDHCMTCSIDGMTNFGAQLDCLLIHTKHTHTHAHAALALSLSTHTHTYTHLWFSTKNAFTLHARQSFAVACRCQWGRANFNCCSQQENIKQTSFDKQILSIIVHNNE